MNNKGMTLVELLITISLTSIISIFMAKLIIDVLKYQNNNDYAVKFQIKRAEIIKIIQNDLESKNLIEINELGSSDKKLVVTFKFSDNTENKLEVYPDNIKYYQDINKNIKTHIWTIEEGYFNYKTAKILSENVNNKLYFRLFINVHTNNSKNDEINNNILDDIIINYYSNTNITLPTNNCIGYYCN